MRTGHTRFLGLIPLVFVSLQATAQSKEPCSQVPTGWRFETQETAGILCADVLLKASADSTRRLRVFESGTLAFETDDAAMCATCGGTLGDPFGGIKWTGTTLSVGNDGGSNQTRNEIWKIAKRNSRWILVGWDRSIADRATSSVWKESVNALTGNANAEYTPGDGECNGASEDLAKCKAGEKMTPKKLICVHPAKSPLATTVKQWRELPFACGLKTP